MSIYNNSFKRYYDYVFTDLADPRTNSWFLISDPVPPLMILVGYLYFVTNWGPRYMKHRKPYELKNTLIVYNFIQVLVSIYIVYQALVYCWLYKYNWKCEPVDFSYSPDALMVAKGVYVYFLAKISELLDTVFFVLRKKDNQITFLHLYHHTVMPMISWGATKYYPGGHGTFIGFINSFVHIIMYTYYMMAAMGPQYQKYLWWKKYITTMQMLQFCITFIHSMQLIYHDCGYPRWSLCFTGPNAIFFYYLFWDFYHKAYRKDENTKAISNSESSSDKKMANGAALHKRQNAYERNEQNGEKADGFKKTS